MTDPDRVSCLGCRSARDHERHTREVSAARWEQVRIAARMPKGASDADVFAAVVKAFKREDGKR